LILCLFFSISAINAEEINNTDNQVLASASSEMYTISAGIPAEENNNTDMGVNDESLLSAGNDNFGTNNDLLKSDLDIGSYSDLAELIKLSKGNLTLLTDYKYNPDTDSQYINGITINKEITIDGNTHTINTISSNNLFIINSDNVKIKNIKILNTTTSNLITWYGSNGIMNNIIFDNTNRTLWLGDKGEIANSIFKNSEEVVLDIESNRFTLFKTNFSDISLRRLSSYSLTERYVTVQTCLANDTRFIGCEFIRCTGRPSTGYTHGTLGFYGSWSVEDCRFIDCGDGCSKIIWSFSKWCNRSLLL
jgi:hypothetical protein